MWYLDEGVEDADERGKALGTAKGNLHSREGLGVQQVLQGLECSYLLLGDAGLCLNKM